MLSHTVPIVVSPPFRLSALPQEAFAHASWQRAEQVTLECLAEGDCVLLLGVPGTGKTLMLHRLAQVLRASGWVTRMPIDGEIPGDTQPGDVLLVDEADTLSSDRLEALCGLANPVVLAGLPAFRDRFTQKGGVVGAVMLEPLSPQEVARFVVGRLASTGRAVSMFGPEAVYALVLHSAGLFRVLAILASASLFFAELRQAKEVTATDVEEAATMRLAVMASDDEGEERLVGAVAPRLRLPGTSVRLSRRVAWAVVAVGSVGALAMSSSWRPQAVVSREPVAVEAELPTPALTEAPAAMEPGPRRRVVVAYVGSVTSSRSGDGKLRLRLRTDGAEGRLEAWVYAWDGFSASGRLQGALAADGKVTLSGRLLLGRHEFECALQASLEGERLSGQATFVRPSTGETAKSNFNLSRS